MNAPVKTPVILSALVDRLAAVKAAAADLAADWCVTDHPEFIC